MIDECHRNVQRGYLDLIEVKTIFATERGIEELALRAGDVLFNEGGDRDKLGRGWVWRNEVTLCIHQNHVFRMRPFLPDLRPELVSHQGNTFGRLWFQSAGKQTTNLASINMGMLRAFPVPVAPTDEQNEILSCLELHLEGLAGQETSVQHALRQAAAQRQNILRAAFSGRLVPQDPNDEPADLLLARIRAERAAQGTGKRSANARQNRPGASSGEILAGTGARLCLLGPAVSARRHDVLAEYALRGIDKPIGVASYELTRALPASLESVLPSIEAIEAELAGKADETSA